MLLGEGKMGSKPGEFEPEELYSYFQQIANQDFVKLHLENKLDFQF